MLKGILGIVLGVALGASLSGIVLAQTYGYQTPAPIQSYDYGISTSGPINTNDPADGGFTVQNMTVVNSKGAIRLPNTVAALGTTCTAAQTGQQFMVSDASSPTALATVAGSGSTTVGVLCNGTNWIVE